MAWIKNEPIPQIDIVDVAPSPVFEDLYRPLGLIVVAFADLEAQLTLALNRLLAITRGEGAALEWFMQNMSLRIELFYFLTVRPIERFPPSPNISQMARQASHHQLRKDAKLIYEALKQANSDRNNLLHGVWTGASTTDIYTEYKKYRWQAQGGKLSRIPMYDITIKLIEDEANFIISINMRLQDWLARHRRWDRPDLWPSPLPDKLLLHSPLARLLRANRKQDVERRQARQRQPQSSSR